MGVFESYDAFSQDDIDLFFQNAAPWVPQGTSPNVISVDGGTAPVAPSSVRNGGESDIDIVSFNPGDGTVERLILTLLVWLGTGLFHHLPTTGDGLPS